MKMRAMIGFGVMMLALASTSYAEKQSRFRSGSEVRTRNSGSVKQTYTKQGRLKPGIDSNIVKEDGRNVIYKKRNVVDFDDSLIEGDVKNPNEFYFVHRPEEKFGTLVQKRKNFHKEMLRDSVMIR
jgi:hypothetical protein